MPIARSLVASVSLAFASLALASGEGTLVENAHRNYVQTYEGTKTCLSCHEKEGRAAHRSIHYQWKAETPNLVNAAGAKLGKINVSNDFCTSPAISWIARVQNAEGKVIAKGCSACHAGLGLKPSPEATPAQLENVDCLICHSATYRRDLVDLPNGQLAWGPSMSPAELLTAAQNPQLPDTATCLRCHAASGGGVNFKRGDLEAAALKSREFDVHLGSSMTCIQCHKSKDHQFVGAGSQMAGQDTAGKEQCATCHDPRAAHRNPVLAKHVARVACTTCHVPTFAKDKPTDMHRDFSRAELTHDKSKYEPAITFQNDVKPVYAWWNGKGSIALPDAPVPVSTKALKLYAPEGKRSDAAAKIYPFKLHTSNMPVDSATRKLVPVKVGILFKTGNTEAAIREGGKSAGIDVKNIEWVKTERYMSIFHEVVPKARRSAAPSATAAAAWTGRRSDTSATRSGADGTAGSGAIPPRRSSLLRAGGANRPSGERAQAFPCSPAHAEHLCTRCLQLRQRSEPVGLPSMYDLACGGQRAFAATSPASTTRTIANARRSAASGSRAPARRPSSEPTTPAAANGTANSQSIPAA